MGAAVHGGATSLSSPTNPPRRRGPLAQRLERRPLKSQVVSSILTGAAIISLC